MPFAGMVIASDDFIAACFYSRIIINDAVANHIYAHVGRGFIRTGAVDLFKDSTQHREDFYIAIIINGRFAICLQMERVDHIDVV